MRFLKPYGFKIVLIFILLALRVLSELSLPNLMSLIVNEIVRLSAKAGSGIIKDISLIGGKMLGVTLVSVLSMVGVSFLTADTAAGMGKDLRLALFKKVNEFESAEFDSFSTASLITRTTNDVQQVQNFAVMMLGAMFMAPLMGAGAIVMALRKSPSLAWIIGVAVLVVFGLLIVIVSAAMPKFKILQSLVDRLNLVSREQLSGLMVVRAFQNEEYEEKRFDEANRELTLTSRFVQRAVGSAMPLIMLVMNFLNIAIVWKGAGAVSLNLLGIGDMMAYLQYAMQIMMAFIMVSVIFVILPRALVSARRIDEILKCEISVKTPPLKEAEGKSQKGAFAERTEGGKIEFKNVSFKYANADENVLSGLSFTAEPHETTAFIGSTGSGKSTLINLIPRFYDVTQGEIRIDGRDIRKLPLKELRDRIGYIPQKGLLFSGSIAENISYGVKGEGKAEGSDKAEDSKAQGPESEASSDSVLPEEDLREVLKIAQAESFVFENEEGLDFLLSQGAKNLSGGQKQRLSIARALAKKPLIYIFDDSFSALDFKTDAKLRAALREFTGSATVLIVAQRVSTIAGADKIVVLDEGKIAGIGTHSELLKSCTLYREICESQLPEEELYE